MAENARHIGLKTYLIDFLVIALGSALFAAGFDVFLDPNSIAPGGVTGVAMIVNRFVPAVPVGVWIIAINVPLFALGFRMSGKRFLIGSVFGTLVSSLFIDLFAGLYEYTEEPLMAAIFGGVITGAGLGLVFTRGATTGGSDIAGRLLRYKFPHVSMGRLMLIIDVVIVLAAALTFGHINYALYAIIVIYIMSLVIDAILYGLDVAKVAYIISEKPDEIAAALSDALDRGATFLHGEGAFTGEAKKVVLCAIKKRQIGALKECVKAADPGSFIIITEAHEVLGDGFRAYDKNAF